MRLIEQTPQQLAGFLRNVVPESIVPLDKCGRKNWGWFSPEGLKRYARWKIGSEGILTRGDLKRTDANLYRAVCNRGLVDALGLVKIRRNWEGMERDELVAFAKGFISAREISGRRELADADAGLYLVLNNRKLLDEVGLPNPRSGYRDWAGMGKEELVAHAKTFIAERGIGLRKELEKADSGLYWILGKRGLLDELGLPNSQSEYRDWKGMGLGELADFAKRFIEERRISSRKELERIDSGLYGALRKRGLLEKIGLERKKRDWGMKTNQELIAFANGFIAERGISGKMELKRVDLGLYYTLFRRKLLDAAFSGVDHSNHTEAVTGVLDALESFGDDS